MNKFLALSFVLSMTTLMSTNGQEMHICKALKGNNGRISFALNIPNERSNKKYIVVKDHYWEVEENMGPNADTKADAKADGKVPKEVPKNRKKRQDTPEDSTPNEAKPGPTKPSKDSSNGAADKEKASESVQLKNIMGKQSDWLKGDFSIGFGIRFSDGVQTRATEETVWVKDVIGLVSSDLSSCKWGSMLLTTPDLKPDRSDTFKVSFVGFKPEMAFTSYSRRDSSSLMLMEQTMGNNKWITRFQEYTMDTNGNNWIRVKDKKMAQWKNDTADPLDMISSTRQVLSAAITELATNYHIKGLFNIYIKEKGKNFQDNGTIVLIENCIESSSKYPCPGPVSYLTCIVRDYDPRPTQTTCKRDDLKQLIDCSKWKEDIVDPNAGKKLKPEPVDEPAVDPHANKSNDGSNKDDKGGSKSWIWILIIVIILVVLVAIVALCLVFRKSDNKSDKSDEKPPKASSVTARSSVSGPKASSAAGPKASSKSMGKTDSTISTRSGSV